MGLTDQQINQKCHFFIALRTDKSAEEKIIDIDKYVKEGGDVNHVDGNDEDNSPLHIAVKRSEKVVVHYLVQNRAIVTQKNRAQKTPMDLALEMNTDIAREIIDILKSNVTVQTKNASTKSVPTKKKIESKISKEIIFPKRSGTSGVGGQLYETKLLSLILMRAVNDKDITKFCLATNLRLIGALDDIFFMYKVGNNNKVNVLALQAKHREEINKGQLSVNDLFRNTGDFSLPKYFDSYLRIKEKLPAIITESEMGDANIDTELNLVLYTPVKDIFDMKTDKQNSQCPKIHKLIHTGKNGTQFQFKYTDEHINILTRLVQEDRLKLLGKTFLDFIMSPKKLDMIMTDPLMRKYHVVLSRKVIQITDTASNNFIMAKFSEEFFVTKEDMFTLLRDSIFKETVQNYCKNNNLRKEEIVILCKKLIKEPTSVNLSDAIGKILTYDDKIGKLKLIETSLSSKEFNDNEKKKWRQDIFNIEVTSSIVNEAVKIAAKNRLTSLEFKLPAYFGTFDLLKKNDKNMKKQQDFMATKFKILFECENNIVEVNENDIKADTEQDSSKFDARFFEISDGIGGMVGNLIVQDNETKMLKFNTSEVLPERANKLLFVLKSVVPDGKNLEDYRLKICLRNFPRLSFLDDEYDKMEAEEFLDRLWFYTNQAKEDGVEVIVKREVGKYYNVEKGEDHFQFRIHSDAVYLRFHDEIQKWWMRPSEAAYLTKDSDVFEKVKKDIVDCPLLTVLKIMYVSKLQKIGIEFSVESVNALNLGFFESGLINIVTESTTLTGIKIKQFYNNVSDVIFIDFDYVLTLPPKDYNTMIFELKHSNIKTLVVVYEPPKNTQVIHEKLRLIFEESNGNRLIIVTDELLGNEIEQKFPSKYSKIIDKSIGIDQFVTKSQNKFLEDSTVIFQGLDVDLLTVIDIDSTYVVRPQTINKLLNKEKIEIGKPVSNSKYEEVKQYFVGRHLRLGDDVIKVNTFQDVDDDVVVITAKPRMGKASLLTHLSIEHKKLYASSWIVRVDLPDYLKDFETWQMNNRIIDRSRCVAFLCTVALKSINSHTIFELEERDSKIVLVYHNNMDDLTLMELELFLYYYNKKRIILLLNGFGDACPPYDKQVLSILYNVRQDNIRIWITCSLYQYAIDILEDEVENLYSLEPVTSSGQENFFYKFFSINLKLEKLNHEQFMNVSDFFQYLTGIKTFGKHERVMMTYISFPLQVVYFVAMKFFDSEFNSITCKKISETIKEKYDFDMDKLTTLGTYLETPPNDENAAELAGTPLYMYVAANYFECKIKGGNKEPSFEFDTKEFKSKWDLIVNGISLYKQFLGANLPKLCQGGSVSEISKNRREFLEKHKRLALLAICKEEHLKKLLTEDEIAETKKLVTRLQTGEERSELVHCSMYDVPKFFHAMLAEYCIFDYIIELMKKTDVNNVTKHKKLWDVLVNILLYSAPKSVRKAFDYKLKHDPEIEAMTNTDECRKIVFDLLLKGNENGDHNSEGIQPLDLATNEGLSNLLNVLVKSIEANIDRDNVTKISMMLDKGSLLLKLFNSDYKNVGMKLLALIRNLDQDLFKRLFKANNLIDLATDSLTFDDEDDRNIREELTKIKNELMSQLKPETVVLIRGICDMFKTYKRSNE